jgi:hypothetical protein
MNKSIITIDKLTLKLRINNVPHLESLLAGSNIVSNGIRLVTHNNHLINNKTKTDIYIENSYVGYFSYDRKTVRYQQQIKLHLSNHLFYVKEHNWYPVTCFILQTFNLRYHGIITIEIAYDSYDKLSTLRKWYNNSTIVDRTSYKPYGRKNLIPYSSSSNSIDCFYFGGKKSKHQDDTNNHTIKEIKVYNKLDEARKSNKQYIIDYYLLNGFDTEKSIDRIELFLRGYLLKDVIESLEQLNNSSILYAIFKAHSINFLKWYDLNSYKWINGNKVYNILELVDFDKYPCAPLLPIKSNFKQASKLKKWKTTIKDLYGFYVLYGDVNVRDTIFVIVKKSMELTRWLIDKHQYFEVDFSFECDNDVPIRVRELVREIELLRDNMY